MDIDRARTWFKFIEGSEPHVYTIRPSIYLAGIRENPTGGIVVWVDQVEQPDSRPMFLITRLKPLSGCKSLSFPRYIATDGEVWCPLITGNNHKYHSYPTGYTGLMLSEGDQRVIRRIIEEYVERFVDDV